MSQLVGHHPPERRVTSWIPGQGTCLVQVQALVKACTRGNQLMFLSQMNVSLPLFLPPFSLSLKIKKTQTIRTPKKLFMYHIKHFHWYRKTILLFQGHNICFEDNKGWICHIYKNGSILFWYQIRSRSTDIKGVRIILEFLCTTIMRASACVNYIILKQNNQVWY